MSNSVRTVVLSLAFAAGAVSSVGMAETAPYPNSSVISGISFDWSTHQRMAEGSDNWPLTWADDDHQYASWGDGGGFGSGDAGLGVARIEGSSSNYRGYNLYSVPRGWDGGKSYGILSVGGVLYMWVSPGSDGTNFEEARLHVSSDHGSSWTKADWAFTKSDGIILPTFLQFGKDYAGARDNYVYTYANHYKGTGSLRVQIPGEIALIRVPKTSILDRSQYEFFAGVGATGNPQWTKTLSARKPVFTNPDGVGWCTSGVLYNVALGRYLLATDYSTTDGNLAVFEGPEPWGPWRTVYYGNLGRSSFYANFSQKWMSSDGRGFVLIFTGTGDYDSWNTVRGVFTSPSQDAVSPAAPLNLKVR